MMPRPGRTAVAAEGRRRRPAWPGLVVGLALWALAIAVKLPILRAQPYGDENLHCAVALHPFDPMQGYTTIWGQGMVLPTFWQRPAYYVLFHFPATLGFEAFRTTHAALASLVAPLGALLLRRHGASRLATACAGTALAIAPILALWGALAFVDGLMTVALLAFLLARHARRWSLAGALALVAIWTKETALIPVAALLAVDLVRALRRGHASLYPLRLQPREAALAAAVALGPMPLAWAIANGLLPPGGPAHGTWAQVAALLLPSPWLLPLLALGLRWRRSRFLSAAGLAACASLLALHGAGRAVEAWYAVPTYTLGVLGCAASADAWVRAAWARRLRRTPRSDDGGARRASVRPLVMAVTVAALAFGACLAGAAAPAGGLRQALQPLGPEQSNLAQTAHFQVDVSERDLAAALDDVPIGRHPAVLLETNGWPYPTVRLQGASHVYFDLPNYRRLAGFGVEDLALRIENATTWTLMGPGSEPMQLAIQDVYQDCLVSIHGGWRVYQGTSCTGRGEALRQANHAHGGP